MLAAPEGGLHDDAGLRAAYAAHGGELYGFAMRSLGDEGMAEDVVQETFVRAWRAAARFDPTLGSLVETYYRGRPAAEVAASLGVPEGTVRSRLYYGLKALRLALEELGWEA